MHENQIGRKLILALLSTFGIVVILLLIGFLFQTTYSRQDLIHYPPPGQLIDVDGHQMHLYCIGEGSPTVVLESGLGETLLNWHAVQKETAVFTRVCAYDHVGFGWSASEDKPVFSPQVADNLHTLLQNAGERAPYVLVGHSIGGIHVRNFAYQYPDEVLGIVLVDSAHNNQRANDADEGKNPLLPLCRVLAPVGLIRLFNLADAWAEANPHLSAAQRRMLVATMNQSHYCQAMLNEELAADSDMTQPVLTPLGNMPLIVLTATQTANRLADQLPPDIIAQVNSLWTEYQLELLALSSNSSQKLAMESAHYIQYDQPELVVEAIYQMTLLANTGE